MRVSHPECTCVRYRGTCEACTCVKLGLRFQKCLVSGIVNISLSRLWLYQQWFIYISFGSVITEANTATFESTSCFLNLSILSDGNGRHVIFRNLFYINVWSGTSKLIHLEWIPSSCSFFFMYEAVIFKDFASRSRSRLLLKSYFSKSPRKILSEVETSQWNKISSAVLLSHFIRIGVNLRVFPRNNFSRALLIASIGAAVYFLR